MLSLRIGDLFTTDAPAIGHGVNTDGVMGTGVAKLVRARYPEAYRSYRDGCRYGLLPPGAAQICNPEPGAPHTLVNLVTQDRPGRHARLEWVGKSLRASTTGLRNLGIDRLALPRIGCGIGGLYFDDVLDVIEQVEADTGFDFEIWTLGSDLRRTHTLRGKAR